MTRIYFTVKKVADILISKLFLAFKSVAYSKVSTSLSSTIAERKGIYLRNVFGNPNLGGGGNFTALLVFP